MKPTIDLKKYIILTESEKEVIKLHQLIEPNLDVKKFNVGFWGLKIQDYDTQWAWFIDEHGHLSGASGHGQPKYTIERLKRSPIFFSTLDADHLPPLQSNPVSDEDWNNMVSDFIIKENIQTDHVKHIVERAFTLARSKQQDNPIIKDTKEKRSAALKILNKHFAKAARFEHLEDEQVKLVLNAMIEFQQNTTSAHSESRFGPTP